MTRCWPCTIRDQENLTSFCLPRWTRTSLCVLCKARPSQTVKQKSMKPRNFIPSLICAAFALLTASCRDPSVGPVLVNASGQVAHISSRFEDGRTINGELEDGRVLWAGYAGAPISSAEVRVSDATFRLAAEELRTPLPGDKWAAFVLKKKGIQQVRLSDAVVAAKD